VVMVSRNTCRQGGVGHTWQRGHKLLCARSPPRPDSQHGSRAGRKRRGERSRGGRAQGTRGAPQHVHSSLELELELLLLLLLGLLKRVYNRLLCLACTKLSRVTLYVTPTLMPTAALSRKRTSARSVASRDDKRRRLTTPTVVAASRSPGAAFWTGAAGVAAGSSGPTGESCDTLSSMVED
jgi:hypothetical protein